MRGNGSGGTQRGIQVEYFRSKRPDRMVNDPVLVKLVNLLHSYEPEQVILFGSRARGEADDYSDYDVIVIKKTERSFLDRLQDMVPYLVAFDHPAEILVYTPEEFEQMRETGLGWVVHQEGIVLYERSANRSKTLVSPSES